MACMLVSLEHGLIVLLIFPFFPSFVLATKLQAEICGFTEEVQSDRRGKKQEGCPIWQCLLQMCRCQSAGSDSLGAQGL